MRVRLLPFLIALATFVGLGFVVLATAPAGGAAPAPGPVIVDGGGTPQAGAVDGGQSTGDESAGGNPQAQAQARARTFSAGAQTMGADAQYAVKGIDVASYQGNMNWAAAAQQGIKFAYVKATEGTTYVNPYFNSQYNGAKAVGMYAGAYVFARPDSPNAAAQAAYFVQHAQFARDNRTLPPMLDLEGPYSGTGVSDRCWGLTAAQMVNWIRTFTNYVSANTRTGRQMLLYTNQSWWNQCTGNSKAFSDQYLDIAYWSSNAPSSLPSSWSKWTVWQYDVTPVNYSTAQVDQNVFNGSLAQLAKWASWGPDVTPATTQSVVESGGVIDLFDRASDGHLEHTRWSGSSGWSATENLGGSLVGGPSAASFGTGRIAVFVRGTDNQLWQKTYTPNAGWSGWYPLGGQLSARPSAVSWGGGRLDVVVAGTDDKVYQLTNAGDGWRGWTHLDGLVSPGAGPAAASATSGQLSALILGQNGYLYARDYYPDSGWTGWQNQGWPVPSNRGDIEAAAAVAAQYTVYAYGPDYQARARDYGKGANAGFDSVPGVISTSAAAAADRATGRTDLFALDVYNQVVQNTRMSPTGAWSGWFRPFA